MQLAGALLLAAGLVAFVGIHVAEFVYPGYSVSENFVSDLGATCSDLASSAPRDCVVVQPASVIFSLSTDALGLLVLAAAYLLLPMERPRRLPLLLGVTGLGALGVGLVSEAYSPYHSIFALAAFLGGALAALESFRILPRPLGYVSLVLGGVALVALAWFSVAAVELRTAGSLSVWVPLGVGGMERMVVYPILLWVVIFGVALLALPEPLAKCVPVAASQEGVVGPHSSPGPALRPISRRNSRGVRRSEAPEKSESVVTRRASPMARTAARAPASFAPTRAMWSFEITTSDSRTRSHVSRMKSRNFPATSLP